MTLTNRFASTAGVGRLRATVTGETTGSTTVEFDRFEESDRDGFISLYETVFGTERGTDWFRWKYRENPYVDHVPIVVARADGELVGARSFFAQEMRVDGDVRVAFQPCDTMVHPDYRRRGLFDRMNELALDRYAGAGPSFFFNFPNENSKPGNLSHGWREIGTVPAYYRPQNPVDVLRTWVDSVASGGVSSVHPFDIEATAAVPHALADVVRSSHRAGDRLVARSSSDVRIERHESPPAEALEGIYRRSVPEAIHTNRTAEFYRWRLANPAHSYETYLARRDGSPVAALVVSCVDEHARIVESLPRTVESERDALDRLLVTALGVHDDRSFVTAFGRTIPTPIRYRFYPDTRFPLSTVLQPTARTLLARDLDEETGVEDRSIDGWALSRLDLDTT